MVSDFKTFTPKGCKIATHFFYLFFLFFFFGEFRPNLSLINKSIKSRFLWYCLNVGCPKFLERGGLPSVVSHKSDFVNWEIKQLEL